MKDENITCLSDSYPSLKLGVELHRTAEGGQILIPVRGSLRTVEAKRRGSEFISHDVFRTDGYLIDFLMLLDGTLSFSEALQKFSSNYGQMFGPMLALKAWNWACAHPELVDLNLQRLTQPLKARITGNSESFFPIHATFEIIETCNFACEHCYYKSSPWKTGRIPLQKAIEIMNLLWKRGVRCIELTGGECTIHPDFCEILTHASKTFDLIAIISNGYRIGADEHIADVVCSIPNVMVQISIDAIGLRHNQFRKHDGAFEAAVKAVQRLQAAGVVTRIASSISESNLDQVVPLFELGKSLGVQKHSFAPVASLGRGCNISDPGAGSRRVNAAIEKALAPYRDDPLLNNYAELPTIGEYEAARNCGAGWRTVAIDYNGDVRACNYSRESKKFGNLFSDSYESIFGQQANHFFHNAPSPGGRDCIGCNYYTYCRGCFVKAFMVSETQFPECPWRRKWFPNMSLGLDENRYEAVELAEKLNRLPKYSPEDSPDGVCGSCARDHSQNFNDDVEMEVNIPVTRSRFLPIYGANR